MRYHIHFRGHIRFTTYVEYYSTIHYQICHIDKYIHVEGPICHNFGRLGISCFEQEAFCKTIPKAGNIPSTFPFPPEVI